MRIESVFCPANPGHRRGGRRLTNLTVKVPRRPNTDVVWTWYSECLVNERALAVFKRAKLTGFKTRSVTIVNPGSAQNAYRELVVTGFAGMAGPKSGIRLKYHCEACGHKVYKAWKNPSDLIDEKTYDGGDFFTIWPLPVYIFVTERAKAAMEKNDITGVAFIPLESLPSASDGTLTPGPPSHWLTPENARKMEQAGY
jgi:hypothetical protein